MQSSHPSSAAAQRASLLVFARWVLVVTHFERELYADPDADLDTLWWDLVERFQLVRRPEGRHAPDWAAKIHLAVVPVYYQNYLYGEMFASQLVRAALAKAHGGLVDRGTGRHPPPRPRCSPGGGVALGSNSIEQTQPAHRSMRAALRPRPGDCDPMNRLADETSPYLRQHADNPVDWYPWGEEAFAAARAEDKPILLSVGYSACHWCHVMAHESFEDPDDRGRDEPTSSST